MCITGTSTLRVWRRLRRVDAYGFVGRPFLVLGLDQVTGRLPSTYARLKSVRQTRDVAASLAGEQTEAYDT